MEHRDDFTAALRRIGEMEEILDETARVRAALSTGLDRLEAAREDMKSLFRYYGSEEWHEDRERSLPAGTRAGVLSEDLVYDEITGLREDCIRMLELSTDILKNVL